MLLTEQYESNGLFAKTIDAPAEEAIKHGYDLGLQDTEATEYIIDTLDNLEWDEKGTCGIRWARLFGGAIGVMLIDDGRGIDEPLDWDNIKSIEEIRIYERAVVWPDYSVMYNINTAEPWKANTSKFGMPEKYFVNSIYGQFWVHESRCLIFRNGVLPERTMQPYYRFWGVPEYLRIKREMREVITSHSTSVKMLERAVQAVHSIKDLASILMQDDGRDIILKRLEAVDFARHILNTIAIDAEGESYEFKTFSLTGVKDILESTCGMYSSVSNIPQTVLFGRSPAGMNSTGHSDFENYYNFVERIQKLMLRGNMRKLVDVIIRAGLAQNKLTEKPVVKLKFNPLWSMDEKDQAEVDSKKAATQKTKADTAKVYYDIGVIDSPEIRSGLAKEGDFSIEDILDSTGPGSEAIDLWSGELPDASAHGYSPPEEMNKDGDQGFGSVGVIVMKGSNVLCGMRREPGHPIGGAGGHIEPGETPEQAAIRETQEEFGITPKNLKPLGQLKGLAEEYGSPYVFLCTEFDGEPECISDEIMMSTWLKLNEDFTGLYMFPPFAATLMLLDKVLPDQSKELHNE